MPHRLLGVAIRGDKTHEVLALIEQAEQLGLHAVWMTTGGARLDSITIFAAAALRTQHIKLGTSIVPSESQAALLPPDAYRCWLSRGDGWHLE